MFRPRVFYQRSKSEPARTMLFLVSSLTFIAQLAALIVVPSATMFFNSAIVLSLSGWAVYASEVNNLRQMSTVSFWSFVMWFYSAIQSVITASTVAGALVWFPMFVVAGCLSIVYIYLSGVAKAGNDE